MSDTSNGVKHTEAELGETLATRDRDDGSVAMRVSNVQFGDESTIVSVDPAEFLRAVKTDLHDSYPTVYVRAEGEKLGVLDHRTPMNGADPEPLDAYADTVVRSPVVEPADESVSALFSRNALEATLREFTQYDEILVSVEEDRPLYITAEGDEGAGVAPQVKEQDMPSNGGGSE